MFRLRTLSTATLLLLNFLETGVDSSYLSGDPFRLRDYETYSHNAVGRTVPSTSYSYLKQEKQSNPEMLLFRYDDVFGGGGRWTKEEAYALLLLVCF
jgi:hypothetical protein